MFFENSEKNLESIIAKSADLTNKPFLHSVVKINGEYDYESNNFDLVVHILCRDKEGVRIEKYDVELEIFKSNRELVLVLTKLIFPEEPILWCGSKFIWMNSENGEKCSPPKYNFHLENLANRIKAFLC